MSKIIYNQSYAHECQSRIPYFYRKIILEWFSDLKGLQRAPPGREWWVSLDWDDDIKGCERRSECLF